jgi:outer membrane lipoprotein-sorting protein
MTGKVIAMGRWTPIFAASLLLGIALPALNGQEGDLTAGQILEKVGERYASLRSYHDKGEVLSHWPDKPGPDRIVFETFFGRPGRFRFDWTSHHPAPSLRDLLTHHVIWSEGKEAYVYLDFPPPSPDLYYREAGWHLAVGAATGISEGSVTTVFPMLIPGEVWGTPASQLKEAVLVGSETFEGVDCYHLRGVLRREPAEVWIGKEDWLLRKVARRGFQDMLKEEIRRPEGIDAEIDAEVFKFRPPADVGEPKERPSRPQTP